MELFRTRDCVEYAGTEPRIPVLNVRVHNPVTRETKVLSAGVDSGFAGHLLLRKETYERFSTAELPAENFTVYSTMAGPIVVRKARVVLEIGKLKIQSYIETPQHGPGRDLIGRRLLRELSIGLLGRTENCCILEEA